MDKLKSNKNKTSTKKPRKKVTPTLEFTPDTKSPPSETPRLAPAKHKGKFSKTS